MAEQDEVSKYLELRKKLVSTHSSILTTTLGKGKHLHNSYLRTLFIARVIDYLAEKAIFSKIIQIPDSIIVDAVCESSHILSYTQTQEILGCLLYEMSDGLELLDREDIGDITVENPAYCFDKTEPSTIKKHLGFKYSLSKKGFESYQEQKFQILAANLLSTRISRFVSYTALAIAFLAFISKFIF